MADRPRTRRYELPCPQCGTGQVLSWEANVDLRRALLLCSRPSCRAPMDLWAEGRWVPTAEGNTRVRGYHLSRLYSPMANLEKMIGEADALAPIDQQAFYNQVLGEVYVAPSGGLTASDLDRCRRRYELSDYAGQECQMGVDVGNVLRVVIRDVKGRRRLRYVGEVDGFADLDPLIGRFNVTRCVIGSQPDSHAAREFARRRQARVWLADYNRHQPGHQAVRAKGDELNRVHINRTEAFDSLTYRFKHQEIVLPGEARRLGRRVRDGAGEYDRHMQASVSTLEQDRDGNWTRRWLNARRADRYAHADVYCMLAANCNPGARILGVIVV